MVAKFDIVLVGASGFVGKIITRYLLTHGKKESFSWAIAGRSEDKLRALKAELGDDARNLEILLVDVMNEQQAKRLCDDTKVVMSTVGPYALYGDTLLKACVESGTDYCDLTGEVQWVRKMIDMHQTTAQKSGARIVPCCGFDSVPSDLGVYYLQQKAQEKFGEPCVRVKMRVKDAFGGFSGGTTASGINTIQETISDPKLKERITNPYVLCEDSAQGLKHPPAMIPVQMDNTFGEWVTPFLMAGINTPVVLRSNSLGNYSYGKAFQYDEAMLVGTSVSGWIRAYGLKFILNLFGVSAALVPGLLKNIIPAPGEGPSEYVINNGYYDFRFWGETASGHHNITVKVTGDQDPGYGSTSKILSQVGLCLAQDIAKKSKHGGFWTPSTIGGDRLLSRLIAYAGLTFDVVATDS